MRSVLVPLKAACIAAFEAVVRMLPNVKAGPTARCRAGSEATVRQRAVGPSRVCWAVASRRRTLAICSVSRVRRKPPTCKQAFAQ
jgi:hypothetical protein